MDETGKIGLGIMASGRGSNARALLEACRNGDLAARPTLVVSNNPDAGVHEYATEFKVPSLTIQRGEFFDGGRFAEALIDVFQRTGTDLICLAGYMKKVPPALIRAYPGAMLNIHPALLPKHGGKGMYGIHVHKAVLAARDSETGVTVHLVDHGYDTGPVLLQRGGIEVRPDDTPDTLATRVLKLEHTLYPEAVAEWIAGRSSPEQGGTSM